MNKWSEVSHKNSLLVRHKGAMHMNDWIAKLHSFLNINDHDILTHAGQIPHGMALAFAESQYVQFHTTRVKAKNTLPSEFDCAVT